MTDFYFEICVKKINEVETQDLETIHTKKHKPYQTGEIKWEIKQIFY